MPRNHTLIGSIRNRVENNCGNLRDYEPPPEVKVYDLQGNLKRIEAPPTPDDLRTSIHNSISKHINGKKGK